jgi:hypothetical protein
MAQFSSQLRLLPSREVQESLLNCVEEGTKMVTSLVDGSLSEGQSIRVVLEISKNGQCLYY